MYIEPLFQKQDISQRSCFQSPGYRGSLRGIALQRKVKSYCWNLKRWRRPAPYATGGGAVHCRNLSFEWKARNVPVASKNSIQFA